MIPVIILSNVIPVINAYWFKLNSIYLRVHLQAINKLPSSHQTLIVIVRINYWCLKGCKIQTEVQFCRYLLRNQSKRIKLPAICRFERGVGDIIMIRYELVGVSVCLWVFVDRLQKTGSKSLTRAPYKGLRRPGLTVLSASVKYGI